MKRAASVALCAVVMLSIAPGASAQDAPAREWIGNALLRALYVATPVVQAIDGVSTLKVIRLGGRETNPLMEPFVTNTAAFTAAKTGIAIGEMYSTHSMAGRHKFLAIATLAGLNAAYLMLAVHNFHVASALEAHAVR